MKQTTIRIREETRNEIAEIAAEQRRDFDSVANELLEEAVRLRRIPGIVFADGPTGRRARIAGTGIEVFEVIQAYKACDQDFDRLAEDFHWLDPNQLRAAIAYWQAYPDEIEEHLREQEYWTPERVWEEYPFMRPPWRQCGSTSMRT